MRYMTFVFLLFFANISLAVGIPSSVSGFYYSPSIGACHLTYARYNALSVKSTISCLFFTGRRTYTELVHGTPVGTCPAQGAMSLESPADTTYISIRYFTAESLYVTIGSNPVDVSNGAGVNEVWQKFPGTQNSPSPYSCPSVSPDYDKR